MASTTRTRLAMRMYCITEMTRFQEDTKTLGPTLVSGPKKKGRFASIEPAMRAAPCNLQSIAEPAPKYSGTMIQAYPSLAYQKEKACGFLAEPIESTMVLLGGTVLFQKR